MLFLAFLDNLDPRPGSSRLRSDIEKFGGFNVTPSAWNF